MAVTFSHLVRKPSRCSTPTACAMRVQDTLPFRYRGILEVDLEICTGCLACERACPIDCIVIDAEKDKETSSMVMTRFDIDMAKCMYCGLCSEPCPTGAIHHTPEFEGADYSLESLVRRFVHDAGASPTSRKRRARTIRRSSRCSSAACATSTSSPSPESGKKAATPEQPA